MGKGWGLKEQGHLTVAEEEEPTNRYAQIYGLGGGRLKICL